MTTEQWTGWAPPEQLLDGKVALVAGGAGGIGAAATQILTAAGATVAIVDNDAELAHGMARRLASVGRTALPVVADLFDHESCRRAVDQVRTELGRIDVLANIAGGMSKHATWRPLPEWTDEAWNSIVHLNLGYVFWLCRAVIPIMEEHGGGAIVNVASIAASFGSPNQSAYGAAKAGLVQLTETMAGECGPAGIRVNAVSPGVVLTPAARAAMAETTRSALTDITPLRRLGQPEDIARAILFFASPIAEFVTGQVLPVDGGVSANFPYGAALHAR